MDIKPPKKRRVKKRVPSPVQQYIKQPSSQSKPDVSSADRIKNRIGKAFGKASSSADLLNTKEIIGSTPLNFKQLIFNNKLLIIYSFVVFTLVFFLYLFRISSLPKATQHDSVATLSVQSFTELSSNIVFGPQKFLDYLLFKLNLDNPTAFRLSSILFTILALIAFFMIVKRWLSIKVAVLAVLLFATSTWTIVQTRDANFMNSFFLVIPSLLLIGFLIRRKSQSLWIFPLTFLLACLTYLPGIIWFLLLAAGIYFKNIKNLFTQSSLKKNILIGGIYILPVLPLAYFIAKNPSTLGLWLGLPAETGLSIQNIGGNLTSIPAELFVAGIDQPLLWLYGSPILDAAVAVLTFAGFWYAAKDSTHPIRRTVLGSFLLVSIGLLAIGGSVYISLLLPLVYIFAALGIYFLLQQWFSTFPRNPVARSIGYIMMCLLVVCITFYHVSRYFIVWPRNDRVIESFESVSSDTIDKRMNNRFYLDKE